ncbi:MAG: glycine cleavage system aminomethyltransferase GcvT [Turicibacter sp.]|nr:glycine cleavage system aminomethyltransferase GcvT [Turicibacter sp.]
MKQTALYDMHIKYNGQMVDFAGYNLPVTYTSLKEEHLAVRKAAGIFDVSHMAEIKLTGTDAINTVSLISTNAMAKLEPGKVRYTLMLNESGGVVDDMLVYNYGNDTYWLVVNAANHEKDFNWVKSNLVGNTVITDVSSEISQIALQGPKSNDILTPLAAALPAKYYTFLETTIQDMPCMISQTGYTGSFGYEIYFKNEYATRLWELLIEHGKPHNLALCGLGSRDTLRLEAAMPLYGHEMDDTSNPYEASLDFAIKTKKEFIGKTALLAKPVNRTRRGLKVTGKGIVRENTLLYAAPDSTTPIGTVTSGTFLPYMDGAYAMALIDKSTENTTLYAEVRGRRITCEFTELPFYKL